MIGLVNAAGLMLMGVFMSVSNSSSLLPFAAGPDGGYCTQPGECLCREGYSGENCSVCNPSVITCGELHILSFGYSSQYQCKHLVSLSGVLQHMQLDTCIPLYCMHEMIPGAQ